MKKAIALMLTLMISSVCFVTTAFAIPEGQTLDDIISSQQEVATNEYEELTEDKNIGTFEKNKDFIDGLNDAGNLATADVEGAKEVTEGIKYLASWIVQVIAYATTALLAVRVVLDLTYIGLPFTRGLLSNGFNGNAQAGAGGVANGMTGGMGGYGMNMDSGMGMAQMGMQNTPSMDTGKRVQLVSNAALNAVAGESSGGQAANPFKLYAKDMVIVFIMVPVLITLSVTGALTNLGFLIGSLLVDLIGSLGNMI